jgi:hypothetical protein
MFASVPRTLEVAFLPPTFENTEDDSQNPESTEESSKKGQS